MMKKTIIVFSGDLDKVMASFIIANGAAAMGDEVTLFFTFWGLNALRKPEHVPGKKSFMEKMFGWMMPKGPDKLAISKMNFGGLGAVMMKSIMKQKQVESLQSLMETAKMLGVKFIACTMSMDVMGFKPDELMEGLEFAGVATYLGEADNANVNLFI